MAPPAKSADGRRKSDGKPSLLVTLKTSPKLLRDLIDPQAVKEESPAKDIKESIDSPATEAPSTAAAPSNANGDVASDSNAATPAADTNGDGTPAPSTMAPPSEGPKKKGVKRSAANANGNDGIPKPRGKPGPKKKPRLEDGTIDHSNAKGAGAHKLGPKANQGAINAGLRALDRSGKPCRKWAKGNFTLKSFTGVIWEVNRWTAPQKKGPESGTEESAAPSADNSSSKENKETPQEENSANNSNSNSGGDVEMRSAPSINASSPAPMAIAAAS